MVGYIASAGRTDLEPSLGQEDKHEDLHNVQVQFL